MEPSNTRSRRLHVEILRHDEIDEVDQSSCCSARITSYTHAYLH